METYRRIKCNEFIRNKKLVCDQTNLIYAYLIFPNAKLSPDFDWSIATDSTHPFSMRAMQELTLHSSIAV